MVENQIIVTPVFGLFLKKNKRIAINIAKAIFPSFVDKGNTTPKTNALL
jgi:hypothetical protein